MTRFHFAALCGLSSSVLSELTIQISWQIASVVRIPIYFSLFSGPSIIDTHLCFIYRGRKKHHAAPIITKCQLVLFVLLQWKNTTTSPLSQRTGSFSSPFALSLCPAEFLSNNPYPELLHSWIPPSDLRELTIGKKPSSFASTKGGALRAVRSD